VATTRAARSGKSKARKNPRLVALRVLRKTPHRYVSIRRITLSITMVLLYAIPLSGLARADLVRGHHMAAFAPVSWILPAVLAMIIVALAFWAATIALTAILGRVFCGFGCLVGQSARLADNTESAAQTGKRRVQAWLAQLGVSALFAGGITLWWVDASVLWEGSLAQVATAIGLYALVFAGVLAHGRWWRWGFCKQLCPIGLYYSVVGQGYRFGVAFDPETCNDCNLCDKACPVGLEPRDLSKPHDQAEGAGFSGLPSRNHCLVCGDCVRACELSLQKADHPALSLAFGVERPTDTEEEASDESPKRRLTVLKDDPSESEPPPSERAA
jgi:polyferredoxin